MQLAFADEVQVAAQLGVARAATRKARGLLARVQRLLVLHDCATGHRPRFGHGNELGRPSLWTLGLEALGLVPRIVGLSEDVDRHAAHSFAPQSGTATRSPLLVRRFWAVLGPMGLGGWRRSWSCSGGAAHSAARTLF